MTGINYDDLSEDNELAFVEVEKQLAAELRARLDEIPVDSGSYAFNAAYISYMSQILAAASALNLPQLVQFEVPSISLQYSLEDEYRDFQVKVAMTITKIKIAHGRKRKGFAVTLGRDEKAQIHESIQKIRMVIESVDLPIDKKDSLLNKLNAFATAVDALRTDLQAWGELILGISDVAGQSADKLSPVGRFIERINRILGQRRGADASTQLPSPERRPQIEPPKPDLRVEDDLPF